MVTELKENQPIQGTREIAFEALKRAVAKVRARLEEEERLGKIVKTDLDLVHRG